MATEKEKKAVSDTETKTVPEPQPTAEQPFNPAAVTLPVLVGRLVQAGMYEPAAMPQLRRDLRVWFNAQPLENRQELAKQFRLDMERAKLITEGLYQSALETVAGII